MSRSNDSRLVRAACIFVIALLTVVSLFPFYIMLVMGTHRNEDLFRGLCILPGRYLLDNLRSLKANDIITYYRNSALIGLGASIGTILVTSMAGFAFAKYRFRMKSLLFYVVIGTMMIPSQLGLIGLAIEMKHFGLVNTLWPMILPPMAYAFGVYWLREYINGAIPDELMDASRIDGCGEFMIYSRIVMPNLIGGLVTVFMLSFLAAWNSYIVPLVLVNRENLYPITVGITKLGHSYRVDYAARILAMSATTLPIIIMFSFGSKYLMRGIMAGSIKS